MGRLEMESRRIFISHWYYWLHYLSMEYV